MLLIPNQINFEALRMGAREMSYNTATVAVAILDITSTSWISSFDIFHELRGKNCSYQFVQDSLKRLVEEKLLWKRGDADSKGRIVYSYIQPQPVYGIIIPSRHRKTSCAHCGHPAWI